MNMDDIKKFFFYVIVYAVIIVFSMGVFEGAYFIYKRFIKKQDLPRSEINIGATGLFIKDDAAGYALKPNTSTADLPGWTEKKEEYDNKYHGLGNLISTNAAGYRGTLYAVQKPANALRILVLGGSATWGCFNNDNETWPAYLEKELKEIIKNKKIEVINAAVGGYTSLQNLEMVKRRFQFYKPDIVLIACWFNDMYNSDPLFPSPWADLNVREALKKSFPPQPKFVYPFPGGKAVCDKIKLVARLIKRKFTIPKDFFLALQNPNKSFFQQFYSDDKCWVKTYFEDIGGIVATIRKKNPRAKFFIVAMPVFFAPGSRADFRDNFTLPEYDIKMYNRPYLSRNPDCRLMFLTYYYHTILFQDLVERRKAEFGYDVILGYPALSRIPLEKRSKYFDDEVHLTAQGNLLLAQEIARQLTTSGNK